MTARILLLVALAPMLLDAQIALYSLSGITPSPLGAVYGYGQVAAGDSKDVRFRALNTGTTSVTITCLKVVNTTGAGFFKVNTSSTPFVVAPGNGMDFFTPSIATVVNDSVVQFVATSKRLASFTVNTGETSIKLNGQPNIVFSTGTTAGKITFTLDSGIYGITGNPSTSLLVAPTLVTIASSSASSRPNRLDVVLDGFDNTYSMGGMSFSFFDRSGRSIAIVPVDFAPNFSAFFQNQTTGSSFRMGVNFPVTGDVTQVGGVEVLLNNAAGAARTPRLNFP